MSKPLPPYPEFDDPAFLNAHVRFILDFYEPRVIDEHGGFFQTFSDNGNVYDPDLRHLVSSTRFVYNYATAYSLYKHDHHRSWAQHGLKFLTERHLQPEGHFAWELRGNSVSDGRAMAYGHAFVILAAASALKAGIEESRILIDDTWNFLEQQFWQQEYSAYADERDDTLSILNPYRGQNANMHLCEALLAAYDATGEERFLDRAATLAQRFAIELADLNGGLIWEHYSPEWDLDLEYNIDKPDDLFKPWGFQPGHQVEWAKLLLQLNAYRPSAQLVDRAILLYQNALSKGWDAEYGGLVYGFAPDGSFCDASKYFWVHAEAFAAAWRLYRITGESQYLDDYQKIWRWSWQYLIDHEQGAWFRIRHQDGSKVDDLKSPPGKTDYHTLGACWDVLSLDAG